MDNNNLDMLARIPNQLALEPVPERFGAVFKKIDAKGLHADARGNGIYEILDAPLGWVATYLQNYIFDKCHDGDGDFCVDSLTPEESQFLQKLGISGDGHFDVDPKMARLWVDRLAINKSLPGAGKVELSDIKVDLSTLTVFSEVEKEEIESILKGTLYRIAKAAQLGKDEVPSVMMLKDAASNNLSIGMDANHFRSIKNLCKVYIDEVRKEPPDAGKLDSMSNSLMGIFVNLAESLPKKSTIVIPESLLVQDFKNFFEVKRLMASDIKAKKVYESVYGFLIGHEVGHLLEYGKGIMIHKVNVAKILYNSLHTEDQFMSGVLLCTQFYNANMLENLLKDTEGFHPGTLPKIKKEYHSMEYEAHIIGVLLAAKAGFDPETFGINLLPKIPESVTHPAEQRSQQFIRGPLRQYSSDMGM